MKINRAEGLKVLFLALIFAIGLIAGYQILKPREQLPVYNPADLDRRLVDENLQNRGRHHRILPFALINQYGDSLQLKDLQGKIIIADFFFTTCPGICKDMARQMRRLQSHFQDDERVVLLSHSVTPEIDSLPVIADYAELQGAIRGKWHILTGDKPQIYRLARQSYFAVLDEGGKGDESDFIHTENFVLVDPQGRLRGFYDGTSPESVDKLIGDVEILR